MLAVISALLNSKPRTPFLRPPPPTSFHHGFKFSLFAARLPKTTYFPETQRTTVSRTEVAPLAIDPLRIPYSFTFGTFTSSTPGAQPVLLADPTAFEEPLLQSNISICLFPRGEICAASQTGSTSGASGIAAAAAGDSNTPNSQEAILNCIDAATERLAILRKVVESTQAQLK